MDKITDNILVAYITDDNYVIPTCVSSQSIKDSASTLHHKITVCTFGISAENEKLLTDMSCDGFEVAICCVNMDAYREMLEQVQ